MSDISLRELQKEQKEWQLRNFGERPAYEMALGISEECGELCHAELKMLQGIRGTEEELTALAGDAAADIIVFLVGYCTARNLDIQDELNKAWARVKARDWRKDSKRGGETS